MSRTSSIISGRSSALRRRTRRAASSPMGSSSRSPISSPRFTTPIIRSRPAFITRTRERRPRRAPPPSCSIASPKYLGYFERVLSDNPAGPAHAVGAGLTTSISRCSRSGPAWLTRSRTRSPTRQALSGAGGAGGVGRGAAERRRLSRLGPAHSVQRIGRLPALSGARPGAGEGGAEEGVKRPVRRRFLSLTAILPARPNVFSALRPVLPARREFDPYGLNRRIITC